MSAHNQGNRLPDESFLELIRNSEREGRIVTLKAENLHAGYVVDIDILSGLTVEARSRQLTTVIGANGVGKSTLLKCMVGQIRPHSGSISYEGRDITGISTNQLVRLGIAYIAQRHSIFPHLSVCENLEMLCRRIVALQNGRVIANGPPEAVRSDPAVLQAYLGTRSARIAS